ncbi:MAG: glycan-binding surface protein [Dysgonamonadaceae bacterium]|jgi:hypothetical protein|nr:glycan-binding surface protein [Dysgonamonadaceae bacterium]
MKRKNKIYLSVIFAAFLMVACQDNIVDYNEGYDDKLSSDGPPKITKITASTDLVTPITEGELAQMIAIQGNNLTGIKSITFNDVEVDLSTIHSLRDRITLPVPRVIPTSVNNQVKVVTQLGEVTAPLIINVPPLILSGLDNEYAAIGDTVNINGANFDLYEITGEKGKVYFGNVEAKIDTTTSEYVAVIVPQGAAQGDKIRIVGDAADMYTPGRYKDDRGLFQDIDHYQGWTGQNWFTDGSNPGDPEPCSGLYTRVTRTLGSWEWFDFIASWYPIFDGKDYFTSPEKYNYKFEVLTLIPLKTKGIGLIFQTSYYWEPWRIVEFNTNEKWKTITVDLETIMNGMKEEQLPHENGHLGFQINIAGGQSESIDICFDNFRIVPKE